MRGFALFTSGGGGQTKCLLEADKLGSLESRKLQNQPLQEARIECLTHSVVNILGEDSARSDDKKLYSQLCRAETVMLNLFQYLTNFACDIYTDMTLNQVQGDKLLKNISFLYRGRIKVGAIPKGGSPC